MNADALSRRPCRLKSCVCHQEESENGVNTTGITVAAVSLRSKNKSSSGVELSTDSDMPNEPGENDTAFPQRGVGREVESPQELLWSWDGLRDAQEQDPDIGRVLALFNESSDKPSWETVAIHSEEARVLWNMWARLRVYDGVLQRKFESPDGLSVYWQTVIPKTMREEFLQHVHGGMTGGHLGREKTAAQIQRIAYWPSWTRDLDFFLKRCEPCARYYRGKNPKKANLQTPLVGEPWLRVSLDITGPHPRSSKSNEYILTMVDHFSRWSEALPLRNRKASTVARALVTHVLSRYGPPMQILTDRGPEFESELFHSLLEWMGVEKLRTTAYHPACNGMVKRFHRTLNSMIGKVVADSQRNWDDVLPLVMAAYRATRHESTGMTPNMLFLGLEIRAPIDLVMGLPPDECGNQMTVDEYLVKLHDNAFKAHQVARNHLRASAERRKKNYDIGVKSEDFKVGDWVWYLYPRKYQAKSAKWQRMYVGPFLVIRYIEPINFVLQKSAKSKPFVTYTNKFKKCYGETPVSWLPTAN